jgi:hypothetical protein
MKRVRVLSDIALFEPGRLQCCMCGCKPEDAWDPDPEGFELLEGHVWCEDCADKEKADQPQRLRAVSDL